MSVDVANVVVLLLSGALLAIAVWERRKACRCVQTAHELRNAAKTWADSAKELEASSKRYCDHAEEYNMWAKTTMREWRERFGWLSGQPKASAIEPSEN